MPNVFNATHEELRFTVREFVQDAERATEAHRPIEPAHGHDAQLWTQLCERLGIAGLVIPTKYGGHGLGPVEQLVVMEELGRALLPAPYLATAVLATTALLESGDTVAQRDLLPHIATGRAIATMASPDPRTGTVAAGRTGRCFRLTGAKRAVLDGCAAELLLVVAHTEGGPSLFAVHRAAEGLDRSPSETMDPTRRYARIGFNNTPARLIGSAGGAGPTIARTLDLAAVALAGEQVGGAQRCLELSGAYARQRRQFGRPIGDFQAVRHRCADIQIDVQSARRAACHAALVAAGGAGRAGGADGAGGAGGAGGDGGDGRLTLAASLAAIACAAAYLRAAADTLRIHGGIGYDWSSDVQRHLRRAQDSELLLGSPSRHRRLVAETLLTA